MLSWQAIRTICGVLLLLPIVHLTYVISRDTKESLDASPGTWARQLDLYAAEDAESSLPAHPILVVGGRGVKLWGQLDDLLAPRPVMMRSLGDAIVEDIIFNYPRLIGFYRPDTVVFLPSNSEFYLRDRKSAAELVAGIRELVAMDASYGVTRKFYIFTPIKTVLRPEDQPTIDQATQQLTDWAATDPRVVILDANPLLSDANGRPRPQYFRGDGVNLNEHGYLRLSVLLYTQVESDTPPAVGNTSLP